MKKKIGRLLQPSMGGYLTVMIAFAVAAALFQNYILAGIELVITAVAHRAAIRDRQGLQR